MFELELPMPTVRHRRRDKLLSLNLYRNLHYQSKNKAKQNYHQIVKNKILEKYTNINFEFKNNISINYKIFFSRKNRKDLMNYGSIIDKFFCDSISEIGIIEDDKIPIITKVSFEFGGYCNTDKVIVRIIA